MKMPFIVISSGYIRYLNAYYKIYMICHMFMFTHYIRSGIKIHHNRVHTNNLIYLFNQTIFNNVDEDGIWKLHINQILKAVCE